jgi:hypothetical protein
MVMAPVTGMLRKSPCIFVDPADIIQETPSGSTQYISAPSIKSGRSAPPVHCRDTVAYSRFLKYMAFSPSSTMKTGPRLERKFHSLSALTGVTLTPDTVTVTLLTSWAEYGDPTHQALLGSPSQFSNFLLSPSVLI